MRSPSPSSSEAERRVAEGVALHRAGQLAAARACYEAALRVDANHPGALHLLGVIELQTGAPARALELIERAIAARPGQAAYLNNRGNALRALERNAEAAEAYRAALALDPQLVDALGNLGATLRLAGEPREAREVLQRALALDPRNVNAMNNLANVEDTLEEHARALELWRACVAAAPRHTEAWRNMGRALLREGRREEAIAAYRQVQALGATSEDLNALGVALIDLRRLDEAQAALEEACRADSASGTPIANLGTVALQRGDYDGALARYREAARVDPRTHAAHNGQGVVQAIFGDFRAALACFERELANYPDDAEARMNRGITLLTLGHLREGWPDYEQRLRRATINQASGPRWQGEAIGDDALLVFPEQGAGDNIQFVRYLERVRARQPEARIVHPVQDGLRRLFAAYLAELRVETPHVEEVKVHGYQISLMSLPALFGTTLTAVPARVPYLRATTSAVDRWRRRLPGEGLRVGLCWGGNPDYALDRERSIAFEGLAPLLAVDGVHWVSLQKGAYAAQAAALAAAGRLLDWTDELGDFADTAALLEALDLVISVDTSVVHLAGALGRPVWLLNRLATDWRWLLERDDSPWYPTLRIFRQPRRGDWETPLAEAAAVLERLVAQRGAR